MEITSSRMGRLVDAIAAVYRQLGLDKACRGDAVFEQLVTARIIEPTSKQDAARVLAEAGVRALSYRTVKRRLPGYATPQWRDRLSGACAAAAELGPSALILYDVTTTVREMSPEAFGWATATATSASPRPFTTSSTASGTALSP